MDEPLRLHIGGKKPSPNWKILNIQTGSNVDFVGNCTDLGQFADGSVASIYASHVLEHLGYQKELPTALGEFHRVLVPGGSLMLSVPDLEKLCQGLIQPRNSAEIRFHLMRIMFGGQTDPYDFHKVGLTWEFLNMFLRQAGFQQIERVDEFGLFDDASSLRLGGVLISLNVQAAK